MYPSSPSDHAHLRPARPSPPPPLSLAHIMTQTTSRAAFNGPASAGAPPPPSPSMGSDIVEDDRLFHIPGPPPESRIWEGKGWALEVIQQPIRARMCGFGDKDRRPISPPPCVRLIIFDPDTREEIDYEKVIDLSKLVLNVDLWNLNATKEDNCVRHHTASPSISSVMTSTYPHTVVAPTGAGQAAPAVNSAHIPNYNPHVYSSPTGSAPGPFTPAAYGVDERRSYPSSSPGQGYLSRTPSSYNNETVYSAQYSNGYDHSAVPSRASTHGSAPSPAHSSQQLPSGRPSQDLGLGKDPQIAKNLIGSASSTAFRLVDEKGKVGLWFVLQDLSVRTEGWFRLKMSFYNLSAFMLADSAAQAAAPSGAIELLHEAPLLASVFSKPFRVYSAKKFPGVIETTALSRQFAKQGIKIPIRKDGGSKKRKGRPGDDDDDDDNDDDE